MSRLSSGLRSLAAVLWLSLASSFAWAQAPGSQAGQAVSAAFQAPNVSRNVLTMGVPGSLYASLYQGKANGVIAEASVKILGELGYATRVIIMSPSEILAGLQTGSVDVGAGLLVKAQPSDGIAYSTLQIREFSLPVTRKGVTLASASLSALQGKQVGARVGFLYPGVDSDPKIKLLRKRKDGELLRELILGTLDMVLIGSVSDVFEFRSEGVRAEIEIPRFAVSYVDLGTGFSSATLSADIVNQFNARLKDFMASPGWQQMLGESGIQDLVKDWPLAAK